MRSTRAAEAVAELGSFGESSYTLINIMKQQLFIISFIVLTMFVATPKIHGDQTPPKSITGPVLFTGSGVRITLGEGWCRYEHPGAGTFVRDGRPCGPTIVNDSGMLTVSLIDKTHSNLESIASGVRAECDSLASADKSSFRRKEFVTESGLAGLHVSYTQENVQPDGRKVVTRCNHYLVTKPDGRCIDIAYLATADRDVSSVFETIRSTLKSE